jgi:hypothetical protein
MGLTNGLSDWAGQNGKNLDMMDIPCLAPSRDEMGIPWGSAFLVQMTQ